MLKTFRFKAIPLIAFLLASVPFVAFGQTNVPPEYRAEIEAVLLSGRISSDVSPEQFNAFVDALSQKAYNANVTGQDLTDARVEALLGSAITGFDAANGETFQPTPPNALFLWGTLLVLIVAFFVARRYRRMYYGGALGHSI